MSTFITKAVRSVPLAVGCLGLVLTGGCLLRAIIPENYYTSRTPIGLRRDASSNVVERLIVKKWFVVHASPIFEESTSECYRTRVLLERTNQASIRYESVERLCADDRLGHKWLSEGWHFRPIPATNLWIGVQGAAQLYQLFWITNAWGRDIDFVVYVFSPESILSERHLRTFAARGRLGFPELIFDSQNEHLTYNTRRGYETYYLTDGTVRPCGEPPRASPLVPRDFGFRDTTQVTKNVGTNFQYYVKVQGPVDQYSRNTNSFLIGYYTWTPNKVVHQRVVATRGFASINCIRIEQGTGVVTYKSGDDEFVFNAVENRLNGTNEPQ